MNLERIYISAKEFMEKEYPDEAPYFDIAWEIFEEIIHEGTGEDLDLKGPVVRLEGNDTIMAPMVIRAFYILHTKRGESEPGDLTLFKSSMMEILSKSKFSTEFSGKVVDFFLESLRQRNS